MQMVYRTGRAFRPIGEKAWWAVKGTTRGVLHGVKWAVPYAGIAAVKLSTGIINGYRWLSPKVLSWGPAVFEKAKSMAARGYAWVMPQVRYVTPLAVDMMAKAGNAASSAVLTAIGSSESVKEEDGLVPVTRTDYSYFINCTVPAWDNIARTLLDDIITHGMEYKQFVVLVRLPDGSIARVSYAKTQLKEAFISISAISMRYPEFKYYPVNVVEILAPHEVQVILNVDGPESVEGYIKSLDYYRDVLSHLEEAKDIVESEKPVRDRER